MNISLSSLASSSSGNCYHIASGDTGILSDCGISFKKIDTALQLLKLQKPNALLVTHSHSDHIKSVSAVIKNFSVPLYITETTLSSIKLDVPTDFINIIKPGIDFKIGSVSVTPITLSHDAPSVGFVFTTKDDKAAIITDTGVITDENLSVIKGARSVIIEANHDVSMVKNGPYPFFLKQRVLSDYGHLSNEACAAACQKLLSYGTNRFMLAHLSEKNNTPSKAFDAVNCVLANENSPYTLKTASAWEPCTF